MPERYGPALRQRLLEPLASLRRLGRRAVLALLGIAMGCGAVVALLNIGDNATAQAMSVFKGLGTDLMVAMVDGSSDGRAASVPGHLDVPALLRELPALRAASSVSLATDELRWKGKVNNVMVAGSDDALQRVLQLRTAQGRFLSPYDARTTHVVLGAGVARELEGVEPGSQLPMRGYVYTVVGILEEQADNSMLPFPLNQVLLVPAEGMRRVVSTPQIGAVIARLLRDDSAEASAIALKAWLERWAPGHGIEVLIPRQLLVGMAEQARTFSWLLGAVAAIALLMGGVGVMNVMLMNVSERRREIGVRRALGARARDIGELFLAEALVLTVTGAALGALFGVLVAWGFAAVSGWAFVLSASALPLGIVSSVLVGLFFGLQPALSAARLAPVQALRDD